MATVRMKKGDLYADIFDSEETIKTAQRDGYSLVKEGDEKKSTQKKDEKKTDDKKTEAANADKVEEKRDIGQKKDISSSEMF